MAEAVGEQEVRGICSFSLCVFVCIRMFVACLFGYMACCNGCKSKYLFSTKCSRREVSTTSWFGFVCLFIHSHHVARRSLHSFLLKKSSTVAVLAHLWTCCSASILASFCIIIYLLFFTETKNVCTCACVYALHLQWSRSHDALYATHLIANTYVYTYRGPWRRRSKGTRCAQGRRI